MAFSDAFRKLLIRTAAPHRETRTPASGSFASLAARLGLVGAQDHGSSAHPMARSRPGASFDRLAARLDATPGRSSGPNFAALASRLRRPSDEGFVYLPVVNGYSAWPDVGTRVLWSEEIREQHGRVFRHRSVNFSGRVTRVERVTEDGPRDIEVWALPDEGGEERRVGIGGIRVPAEDVPRFRARAEQATTASMEKRARRLAAGASHAEATSHSAGVPSKVAGSQRTSLSLAAAASLLSQTRADALAVRASESSSATTKVAPSASAGAASPPSLV